MQSGEIFDYKGVKDVMDKLDMKFAEFAELLKNANDCINKNVNVSAESAIYGVLGNDILDTWNQNASTFGDFYENFSTWSQLVASIANSYASFENSTAKSAISEHKSNGANMAGIQNSRINMALRSGNEVVTEGATSIETNNDGSKVINYSDGTTATYKFKDNGEVKSISIKNTDGTIEERFLNAHGNYRINSYDKNGNVVSNIDYNVQGDKMFERTYNSSGEVKSVTTYNEDGSIKEQSIW